MSGTVGTCATCDGRLIPRVVFAYSAVVPNVKSVDEPLGDSKKYWMCVFITLGLGLGGL